MTGNEQQNAPTTECLIAKSDSGRTGLERFRIEKGEEKTWGQAEEERFYFLLDVRGTFAVSSVGAKWKFEIHPDTAIWVPTGLEHTLRNSGDAPSRGVVFIGSLGEDEAQGEKTKGESPIVLNLHSVPQRNMVSFLSRTLYGGREVSKGVFLLSEYQTVLPGGWVPGHLHESREEVSYVCKGSGKLHVEETSKVVSPGEAVRIPAGLRHSMRNENEDVLEYILVQVPFSGSNDYRKKAKQEV